MCTASGCHLFDPIAGDYNSPFVRHFFPDKTMLLITMAYREQILIVTPGNPFHIHGIKDLTHNVPFINRNRGSGTLIWLDNQLNRMGISLDQVLSYHNEAYSRTEVAIAIQHGQAQVGSVIKAAAVSYHLDFVLLFEQRYDLVMEKEQVSGRAISPLFDTFYSGKFRSDVQNLAGCDVSHLGEQIIL